MLSDLSTTPQYADFLYQIRGDDDLLVDYEIGGKALFDPSQGDKVKIWKAEYDGLNIILSSVDDPPTNFVAIPNCKRLALAFDQNINPFIAYENDVGAYIYWYDTTLNKYTTTGLPSGSKDVCLTADDNRDLELTKRTVVLAYRRGNVLYGRQLLDRFTIEYSLGPLSVTRLITICMNRILRLQYKSAGLPVGV